jgi:hypothetical protein
MDNIIDLIILYYYFHLYPRNKFGSKMSSSSVYCNQFCLDVSSSFYSGVCPPACMSFTILLTSLNSLSGIMISIFFMLSHLKETIFYMDLSQRNSMRNDLIFFPLLASPSNSNVNMPFTLSPFSKVISALMQFDLLVFSIFTLR